MLGVVFRIRLRVLGVGVWGLGRVCCFGLGVGRGHTDLGIN